MKKRLISALGSIVLFSSLLGPTYAAEQPKKKDSHHEYSINGFLTHAEMAKRLESIARSSQGNVSVEVAGTSNKGREIYKASVGTGDKVILIQSEIHGNEKTGTEALMNILQYLGTSNSPHAKKVREEVTLVLLPKMNPDAAELDRRRNDMTWNEVVANFPQLKGVSPAWNYFTRYSQSYDYSKRPGFDVNRDFNPNLDYVPNAADFPGSSSAPGWFITPEAQVVRDVYKQLLADFGNVDVFIDLHHQGIYYVDGTDDVVTLSLSGQFVPDPNTAEGSKYAEYKDKYHFDFSRQLNLAAYNALQQMGDSPFGNITLYQQGLNLPGTALGSFALNGSGTVLFEVTGQTQSLGQKKRGQLVKAVERGLFGIINGVSDDSVYDLDPSDYDDIPLTAYKPASFLAD